MKIVAICVLAFSLIGVLQARPKISDRETEMEEIDLLALMENMEAEEEQEDSYDEVSLTPKLIGFVFLVTTSTYMHMYVVSELFVILYNVH